MKIRHTQTQSSIGFKPSVGGEHDDAGGFVGVFFWKDQFTKVDTSVVGTGGVGIPLEDVVPFEYVGFVGLGDNFGGFERIF